MNSSWAVTPQKIKEAVHRIVELVHPEKIILFGSSARAQSENIPRDVDLLVVLDREVKSVRKITVSLYETIRGIFVPFDILVISRNKLEQLADHPGLVYREALQNGKVIYES